MSNLVDLRCTANFQAVFNHPKHFQRQVLYQPAIIMCCIELQVAVKSWQFALQRIA